MTQIVASIGVLRKKENRCTNNSIKENLPISINTIDNKKVGWRGEKIKCALKIKLS